MQVPNPSATSAEGIQGNFETIFGVVGLQIDSTGLTSAQLEAQLQSFPSNVVISDPTNHLLLVRQGSAWYKVALTAV